MAALPSVVIGFLAGLWLAPLVERTTVGTLLLAPMVPLVDRRGGPRLPGAAARDAHALRPAAGDAPPHRGRPRGRLARLPARSLVRADGLRRGLQELALRELAGPVRPAQLDHHRLRDGVRRDPDHLHDQRGRVLERPGPPLRGEPRARRLALADGHAGRPPDGVARGLLGGDDRLRPGRRRDDDRAHGDGQHADHGLVDLQRHADAVGEHRRRDPRGALRRDALPRPLLRGGAPLRHDVSR